MTKLDRKLNIVLSYPREQGAVYVHSTPISRQVFERYYRVIAKAFTEIHTEGLGIASGPRVAYLLLKEAAEAEGTWPDVQSGLIAEIRRLTMVIVSTESDGWQTLPYGESIKKGLLDEDEQSEVDNALAFFTVASRMYRKQDLIGVLGIATSLWGASIVSQNSTEYSDFLRTSKEDEDTSKKVVALSTKP